MRGFIEGTGWLWVPSIYEGNPFRVARFRRDRARKTYPARLLLGILMIRISFSSSLSRVIPDLGRGDGGNSYRSDQSRSK
jgi:hypothetical protein